MRIVIIGAAGATGRQVVQQAVEAGDTVTAVVRRPEAFSESERLRVVVTELHQAGKVDAAMSGQDAVISALGATAKGPSTVCTDGMRSILDAMRRNGRRRLVVVSAYGAADTHDRSLYSLMLWASVRDKMRDKESMEALVQATDVDWTIVRPPRLTNGPHTGNYQTGTNLTVRLTSNISRADLADFLLTEVHEPAYTHQLPRITT